MLVFVIGVSVRFVVEVAKLHLDHTPRWPTGITPPAAMELHQILGHYPGLSRCRSQSAPIDVVHVSVFAAVQATDRQYILRPALETLDHPSGRTFL